MCGKEYINLIIFTILIIFHQNFINSKSYFTFVVARLAIPLFLKVSLQFCKFPQKIITGIYKFFFFRFSIRSAPASRFIVSFSCLAISVMMRIWLPFQLISQKNSWFHFSVISVLVSCKTSKLFPFTYFRLISGWSSTHKTIFF